MDTQTPRAKFGFPSRKKTAAAFATAGFEFVRA
jgi:hypothetical protein